MYIYSFTHAHAHIYIHTFTHSHIPTYPHTHTFTHSLSLSHTHTHTHTYMDTSGGLLTEGCLLFGERSRKRGDQFAGAYHTLTGLADRCTRGQQEDVWTVLAAPSLHSGGSQLLAVRWETAIHPVHQRGIPLSAVLGVHHRKVLVGESVYGRVRYRRFAEKGAEPKHRPRESLPKAELPSGSRCAHRVRVHERTQFVKLCRQCHHTGRPLTCATGVSVRSHRCALAPSSLPALW
jgi:hypothetical protein